MVPGKGDRGQDAAPSSSFSSVARVASKLAVKVGLPSGWEACPVWRAWVCEAQAVVITPGTLERTGHFLGEFCRSTGGCRVHLTEIGK